MAAPPCKAPRAGGPAGFTASLGAEPAIALRMALSQGVGMPAVVTPHRYI